MLVFNEEGRHAERVFSHEHRNLHGTVPHPSGLGWDFLCQSVEEFGPENALRIPRDCDACHALHRSILGQPSEAFRQLPLGDGMMIVRGECVEDAQLFLACAPKPVGLAHITVNQVGSVLGNHPEVEADFEMFRQRFAFHTAKTSVRRVQ